LTRIPKPQSADRAYFLRQWIREQNYKYHVLGCPEVTDAIYDQYFAELLQLEAEHPELREAGSPTQSVGGQPIDALVRVEHVRPMLSIDNCFTLNELDTFDERARNTLGVDTIRYSVEYKIDGCAVALRYERGIFVQAVTRGDGAVGDDITHNARTFRGLPCALGSPLGGPVRHDIVEVRGEAYMRYSDFAEFKAAEEALGHDVPANPRNSTAGAIRQLDSRECHSRKIRFMAHGVGHAVPLHVQGATHSQFMAWLKTVGMPCVHGYYDLSYSQVTQQIAALIATMPLTDIPIDGIVIKVDSRAQALLLGATGHHGNWCKAYKWERYEAETAVLAITIQVGKTGVLTPVAELEPVAVAETTVSRASLFNKDEIERLDIRIGDRVVVEKAGKIIPHIVRVEKSHRPTLGYAVPRDEEDPPPYVFPTTCPVCGAPAVQDEDGVYIRCTNTADCPAQLQAAVEHFCSRKCMDIRGMGPALIAGLIAKPWFHDVSDLYRLLDNPDALLDLPKVGVKKRNALITAIELSKVRPLECWLAGLNVRHLGLTASRTLARHVGTIWSILGATKAELLALEGVGASLVDSWVAFADSVRGKGLIARLITAGLSLGQPVQAGDRGKFDGLIIVPTGVFMRWSREEIKDVIRRNGGRASSSVSKNTTFIVAGKSPGAKKIQKARELNIEVIDESVFLAKVECQIR
jgi:DNA ligase (NAD+)